MNDFSFLHNEWGFTIIFMICPVNSGTKFYGYPSGYGAAALFFKITSPVTFERSIINSILDEIGAKSLLTLTDLS